MALIRVKHDDPTARISFATASDPDEKGGFLVPDHRVPELAFHGWRVVHIEHDAADEAHKAARLKTAEEAAAAVRQRSAEEKIADKGGVPDPDFSKDEGDEVEEVEEDDPDSPPETDEEGQPKPKKRRRLMRRK